MTNYGRQLIKGHIDLDKSIYKMKDEQHLLTLNWEYYPAFSNYNNNNSPDSFRKIVRIIFDNENPIDAASSSFEKKYLKYKAKYLQLKKLIKE